MCRGRRGAFGVLFTFLILTGCATATQEPGSASINPTSGEEQAWFEQGRRLVVRAPEQIRLGDAGVVTLEFLRIPTESESSLFVEPSPPGELLAVAQLEIPRMVIEPSGRVTQPFGWERDAVFRWRVEGQEAGNFQGTAWFFLQGADGGSDGAAPEALAAAVSVEMRVRSLAGLRVGTIRLLGFLGVLTAGLMALPLLLTGGGRKNA